MSTDLRDDCVRFEISTCTFITLSVLHNILPCANDFNFQQKLGDILEDQQDDKEMLDNKLAKLPPKVRLKLLFHTLSFDDI